MDLSQYNLGQLKQLQDDLLKEIAKREKAERQGAINQIYQLAHQFNIPLKSLLAQKERKPRAAPLNNYRDPNNPENTWTGLGKRPKWLKDAIDAGGKLEQFRVSNSAHH